MLPTQRKFKQLMLSNFQTKYSDLLSRHSSREPKDMTLEEKILTGYYKA